MLLCSNEEGSVYYTDWNADLTLYYRMKTDIFLHPQLHLPITYSGIELSLVVIKIHIIRDITLDIISTIRSWYGAVWLLGWVAGHSGNVLFSAFQE